MHKNWFRTKLEVVELILTAAKFTKADVLYWEEERRLILKELLNSQLENLWMKD